MNRREIKLRFDSFEVALRGPESIVGRSGYSSVVLSDPSVSRVHASIVLEGDHGHVRDLGSKNGTFVNGRRIGGDPEPFVVGDALRFGDVMGVVEVAEGCAVHAPSTIPPSRPGSSIDDTATVRFPVKVRPGDNEDD